MAGVSRSKSGSQPKAKTKVSAVVYVQASAPVLRMLPGRLEALGQDVGLTAGKSLEVIPVTSAIDAICFLENVDPDTAALYAGKAYQVDFPTRDGSRKLHGVRVHYSDTSAATLPPPSGHPWLKRSVLVVEFDSRAYRDAVFNDLILSDKAATNDVRAERGQEGDVRLKVGEARCMSLMDPTGRAGVQLMEIMRALPIEGRNRLVFLIGHDRSSHMAHFVDAHVQAWPGVAWTRTFSMLQSWLPCQAWPHDSADQVLMALFWVNVPSIRSLSGRDLQQSSRFPRRPYAIKTDDLATVIRWTGNEGSRVMGADLSPLRTRLRALVSDDQVLSAGRRDDRFEALIGRGPVHGNNRWHCLTPKGATRARETSRQLGILERPPNLEAAFSHALPTWKPKR